MSKHVKNLREASIYARRSGHPHGGIDCAADALELAEKQNRALKKLIKNHCVQLRLDSLSVWASDLEYKCRALAKKAKVNHG